MYSNHFRRMSGREESDLVANGVKEVKYFVQCLNNEGGTNSTLRHLEVLNTFETSLKK